MNSSVDFENKVLDAIETITQNIVNNAGYDKTIQAIVLDNSEASIGKYKVKYQDSEWEAYSNNVDISYSIGAMVNVLIPGNDFNSTKTIIDAVDKKDIQYGIALDDSDNYIENGGNAIAATQEFGMSSYRIDENKIYLYQRDSYANSANEINFDAIDFNNNIKEGNAIICGAEFKTNLADNQKAPGNFGVTFEMEFKDNFLGEIVTKNFTIDVNSMIGNPYEQKIFTNQYKIFNVDSENFVGVKNIYMFTEDFPNSKDPSELVNDIFIQNFQLQAITRANIDELNNYVLTITKPDKTYFDKTDDDSAIIKMVATLKYKTKTLTDKIDYYWFKEDNSINSLSLDYQSFGGDGWACINRYNIIGKQAQAKVFIPEINTMLIDKEMVPSYVLKIKCVAVKNNISVAERVIDIYNYASDIMVIITSDQGNLFFADDGNPTLTCTTGTEMDSTEALTYKWSVIDNNNTRIDLEESTEDNNIYNAAALAYAELSAAIDDPNDTQHYPNNSQPELDRLSNIMKSYDYKQRVEGNQIHHVNLKQIKYYSTFVCSVYDVSNSLLGTAQITLENRKNIDEGLYKLQIYNGDQTYIYNTMGVSPVNNSLEKTLNIEPLSFTIVDKNGKILSERVLERCDIEWIIPDNSLISATTLNQIYLNYTIADQYDYWKINNNTIKLRVKYKNLILEGQTSFNFIKEGEPGTNGTDIICKILPNTNEEFNEYPMLINNSDGTNIHLNFVPKESGRWFKVQLWKDGKLFWEGYDDDSQKGISDFKWSMLANKYTDSDQDTSTLRITNGIFDAVATTSSDKCANILKAELVYNGIKYYSTLPIITCVVTTSYGDTFRTKLKMGTGYRYVLYSSDGRQPKYDNIHPFTIVTERLINNVWEDAETLKEDLKPGYRWIPQGKIGGNTDQINFKEPAETGYDNPGIKIMTPVDEYDGECVTNAIKVYIYKKQGHDAYATLFIPVHFYLNKYGIAALNNWDGNSIKIDHDKGSILTPQVGAGKKEEDNTFTGVLMGSVKESGANDIEQGLFGYNQGKRTIFLDANTGKAEFGKAGAARIILDPTSNKAQLYSGNYVAGTSGMMIDLTTPEIKFGNNKFTVNSNGILTAKGATIDGTITVTTGDVGNWKVDSNGLKNNTDNPTILLDADGIRKTVNGVTANMAIYANGNFGVDTSGTMYATGANITGKVVITDNSSTFNTGTVGGWTSTSSGLKNNNTKLVLSPVGGVTGNVAVHDSGNRNDWGIFMNGKFGVTTAGDVFMSNAHVAGQITATSGKIAGYTIDGDTLYGATVGMDATSGGHYAFWAGADVNNTSTAPFRVSHDGYITATRATITGAISATSGSFGNGQNKIIIGGIYTSDTHCNIHSGQKNTLNATTNGFYIGTDGISLGTYDSTLGSNPFQVTTAGALTARSGKIGGYTIDEWRLYGSKVGMCAESDHTDWAFWAGAAQGSSASAPFRVGHNGELYSSNITVTGGSLKIGNRFEVNSSGRLVAKTSGGGQLSMGQFSNHPYVSGLNVGTFGIDMNSSGISKCTGLTNSGNLNFGSDSRLDIYGNTMYLRAKAGLGSMVFLTGGGSSGFTGLDLYNLVNGSSSIKMKTNIQQLSINDIYKLYDTVLNMPVYSYYYKKQYNDPTILHHGFIIEDIENSEINNYLHFKQDDYDNNIKIFNNNELPKMNLILIKALQNKIKELEEIIKKEGK